MELSDYLDILRRRWRLIGGVLTACLVATAAASLVMPPTYEGVAKVEIVPVTDGTRTGLFEVMLQPAWTQTHVELMTSTVILQDAAERLGGVPIGEIRESLDVRALPDTQIVEITTERASATQAAEWTNAVAQSFTDYRHRQAVESSEQAMAHIQRQLDAVEFELEQLAGRPDQQARREALQLERIGLQSELVRVPDPELVAASVANVISPAEPDDEPVRPSLLTNMAIAIVLGAMLGVGGAFAVETLADRPRSTAEVERLVSAPALGLVPKVKGWNGTTHKIAGDDPQTEPAAEAYRTLGINLAAIAGGKPPKSILVTSAGPSVGKSTTSANLAAMMARAGYNVTVVAGEFRKPSIHEFFGLSNDEGVAEVVHSGASLNETIQQSSIPNLRLLPAGTFKASPTEILGSRRFEEILEELKEHSDLVIVDSTPILGLGDANALAAKVDAVLLVVGTDSAKGKELVHAAQQIQKAGGNLVGCVINGLDAEEAY
ncbi:MAG: polysaccharide biosynthesis tyrosine autokinase, partial [Dehalococcoidia bacterium]